MARSGPRAYGVGGYSVGPYERYPATFIISAPCSVGVWAPAGMCGGNGTAPRLTTKPRSYGVAAYGVGAYERSPGTSNLWQQLAPCSPGIWSAAA